MLIRTKECMDALDTLCAAARGDAVPRQALDQARVTLLALMQRYEEEVRSRLRR